MPFDVDVEPPSDPLYLHLWLSQFSRHLCLLANELLACPIEPCPQSLAAARTFIHAAVRPNIFLHKHLNGVAHHALT